MSDKKIDALAVTPEHRHRFNRMDRERAAFGLPSLFSSIEAFVADESAKRQRLDAAFANRRAARIGGAA